MSLMTEVGQKAFNLGVPIAVHMDVTYRCNERCVHCYLDHDDHGEMTTEEIKGVLDQLAEAGVFFLTFSGGEVFMRRDFFELVEHARRLMFNVKIKTNAVMIHEEEARRIRALGVDTIQISVYSHRPEVHDAITKLPHSFERTVQSIRFLREQGLRVTIANVLMTANYSDHAGVQELAAELDAQYTLDPTITPMMDGDTSVLGAAHSGRGAEAGFQQSGAGGKSGRVLRSAESAFRRRPGRLLVQRGTLFLLHLALWRRVSLRAVSAADGEPSAAEIFGYLEFFAADAGSSVGSGEASHCLLVVLSCQQLLALPRPRLYGRKHARAVHGGLREVVLSNGRAHGEYAATGAVEAAQHDRQYGTLDPDPAGGCPRVIRTTNSGKVG